MLGAIARPGHLCEVSSNVKQGTYPETLTSSRIGLKLHPGGARYLDGVCQDPIASLAHEVSHCFARAIGPLDLSEVQVPSLFGGIAWVRKWEINAVLLENRYRATSYH